MVFLTFFCKFLGEGISWEMRQSLKNCLNPKLLVGSIPENCFEATLR